MKRKERDDDTSDSEDDSYTNTNNTIKNNTTTKNFKQNKVIRLNDSSSSSNNNKQINKLNDTLFVPTANDIFESAVMKRLKDTNTINKSKKFKYDAKQIQKVCTELKDQYNINLKFGRTWISGFQRRHNLVKDTTTITTKTSKTSINPVKNNTVVNDNDDDNNDDNINDGDDNNDDDNNNNDDDNNNDNDDDDNNNDDNKKSIPSDIHLNQPFEAAVLNKLKDIVPAHLSKSKFLYNYSQIKNVCLELKNQYDMKGCIFSSTWISSFQTRHNLIQIQHEIIPAIRNKCRYCHCLAKSLVKKGLKVLKTTLRLHESKCMKNPSYRFIENTNDGDNNSINQSNISNHRPSLLELSLLRNHSRSKKLENIKNDYRSKNITMTKETLIEDWNMISDETKSKIIMKVSNGNHIRKKKLMKLYNNRLNKRNIPKYEHEIQVPFNNNSNIIKNDYIPKKDEECNIIEELKGRGYINNTVRKFCSIKNKGENSNIKKQKKIVTKMLNSMTMIPIDDQFIAKNFKKQNVIEANQNITNIKDKLLNFLNM